MAKKIKQKRIRKNIIWATIFVIPSVIIMLFLGAWQVERLEWKQGLLAMYDSRINSKAINIEEAISDGALTSRLSSEFLRVYVEGEYLNDYELYLVGRSRNGESGFHIITPFIFDNDQLLYVDRGFLPFDKRQEYELQAEKENNYSRIEGILRNPNPKNWFVPDNDSASNTWYFIDLEAMAEFNNLESYNLSDQYLFSALEPHNGYPIGEQWIVNIPNNHLSYLITWFSMAFVFCVMFGFYIRKQFKS